MTTLEEYQRDVQKMNSLIKGQPTYEQLMWYYSVASYMLEDKVDKDYIFKVTNFTKQWTDRLWQYRDDEDEYYRLLYNTYLLEAQDKFDSYLMFLEKNRELSEKFYEPKRKQLNKHGIIQAMQDLEDDKLDRTTISMPPGTQKCQPLYSKILTPNGYITMGEVEIGTEVIAGNGSIAKVISLSPIKKRPIYEITLDDGSKCRCSDNHLWKVQTRDDRARKNKDGSEKYRVIELSQMLKNIKIENGKRCNYSIDYVPIIDINIGVNLELSPYVVGCLIGDGSLSSGNLRISTKDLEILDKMKMDLPSEYEFIYVGRYDYSIKLNSCYSKQKNKLTKLLEKYELKGKTAKEKRIPKEYLFSSYENRLWLLRGLLDTDGYTSKDGTYCNYATISKGLSEDVKSLVNSLGGYASISVQKAGYKKDGIYKRCNDCYIVNICFSSEQPNPFYLKRKANRYKPKRKSIKRYIKNIEYIGDEDCRCIMIDDPCHLYITDNYIITHNTTALKFFASWIAGKYPKDYSLFFSHSGDITRKFYDGMLDILTDSEYTWGTIFPKCKVTNTNAKLEEININKYKPYSNIQCSSVGAKNSGKVRTNRYLYCDDLIGGIEEALNPMQLDKVWRIYGVDLKQRKLNQQVKEIMIMTRWSTRDPIGRLKTLYEDDNRNRFIAVPDIDPQTGESNFDYEYNGMSVEFFNDQAMTMDEVSYKCLYKNEPIEREGQLFPEDKLRRYFNLPQEECEEITGQVDCKGKGTDFMVMPVLYKYGEDYYMEDCICNNGTDYEIQYEELSQMIVNHAMQNCEFESNAGGDRVSLEVNKRVEDKGWICNITDKPTETNKEAKIYQYSNWIMQHILFKDKSLYNPQSAYGKFMSLLCTYSVSARKQLDDVPDCLSNFALRKSKIIKHREAEIRRSPI